MKAEFYNAKGFRELMGSLAVMAEEVRLRFSDVGVSVLEMDSSHVAMVELKLPCEMFDRYSCEASVDDPLVATVNVGELVKMLKRGKDELLILEYEDGGDYLGLTLRGGAGGVTRVKRVPVLEPLEEEMPECKIFFKAFARVLSKDIHRLVLPDAGDVSEHCQVGIGEYDGKDVLMFSATGDMGSCRVVYERHHDQLLELKYEESVKATYTLSYLKDIFKGFKDLSEVVNISLSEDMPIRLEPELPQGTLVYHLAPCIGV